MAETLYVKTGACIVRDDSDEFDREAARLAESILAEAIRARGSASVAVAGGNTPRGMHRAWTAITELPWGSVELYFGDERCVPPDDEQSNYRAVLEDLLCSLPLPGPKVHRIQGEDTDPQRAARRYAASLPERLDLLILGLGPDGHTASLFPGDAAALEDTQLRVAAIQGPKPPTDRITITPPVITGARQILVLARGSDKARAVQRARHGEWNPIQCPAQLARRATFLLDSAAASELP